MNPKLAAYEESPTRIDIYIAALLQGAVERGYLNMSWSGLKKSKLVDKSKA